MVLVLVFVPEVVVVAVAVIEWLSGFVVAWLSGVVTDTGWKRTACAVPRISEKGEL